MTNDPFTAARATLERAEGAARDTLVVAQEAAGDGLQAAQDFLTRQARERPLATIGAAVGVGLILGLLLTRRD